VCVCVCVCVCVRVRVRVCGFFFQATELSQEEKVQVVIVKVSGPLRVCHAVLALPLLMFFLSFLFLVNFHFLQGTFFGLTLSATPH
jgi:hypothetical protein